MKRLDAGTTGDPPQHAGSLSSLQLREPWEHIVAVLTHGRALRPVQQIAVDEVRILESRQHAIVCAPTNSGKSVVGYLMLIDALLQGRRAVLLEPLRALAQETAEELSEVLAALSPSVFKTPPTVRISTGDYRNDNELPFASPSTHSEITVATPERLDAILRNPNHAPWVSTIGAVVVDEAHMLADPRRGPTLELIIASMLSLSAPPRLALLSATLGQPEGLRDWLHPCQLVISNDRTPLAKQVLKLDSHDDPDAVLAAELRSVLLDPDAAAIVFVYRRDSANALAKELTIALGSEVLAYHAGQSTSERASIRSRFRNGTCRCLVATTALAMGINLPATHVFVRDTTYFGAGKLRVEELLQILGRAGRGDRSGTGVVLVRPGDDWEAEELAQSLHEEALPPLRSSFESNWAGASQRNGNQSARDLSAATLVAACLARAGVENGLGAPDVATLLGNTLGARSLVPRIDKVLSWLADPSRAIAYKDEQARFHLTVLGRAGVTSMLPLEYVAGLGQLIRDLLSLDAETRTVGRWSAMDHLLVMSLLCDRAPSLRRFSEDLASQIDGWHETRSRDEKSLLFAEWVMGSASASKADELLGSIGCVSSISNNGGSVSRRTAYGAMLAAIVLDERSRGVSVSDVERRWGISNLDGIEEGWRDTALWMLAGHTKLLEVRAFYYYLRESCEATPARVKLAKQALGRMRMQAYDLLERLRYCSPLGPLVRAVRAKISGRNEPVLGAGTIRTLEAAGVRTLQQVAALDVEALVTLGVQRRFAKQIRGYLRDRMR